MLTVDQVIVLNCVRAGMTRREMAKELGKSATMAQRTFKKLVAAGYIQHVPQKAARNRLTAKAELELGINREKVLPPSIFPTISTVSGGELATPPHNEEKKGTE